MGQVPFDEGRSKQDGEEAASGYDGNYAMEERIYGAFDSYSAGRIFLSRLFLCVTPFPQAQHVGRTHPAESREISVFP